MRPCWPRSLDVLAGASATPRGEAAPLLEELSEAELRVVRYLPGNLEAPEIAAELFVSPNTVRTHIRHIYAKLDAHSRKEAVERARGLGLISSGSDYCADSFRTRHRDQGRSAPLRGDLVVRLDLVSIG